MSANRKSRSLMALINRLAEVIEHEPYDRRVQALCITVMLVVIADDDNPALEIERLASFMRAGVDVELQRLASGS